MNTEEVIKYIEIIKRLEKSRFRSKFRLDKRDLEYMESLDEGIIEKHSIEILTKKIKEYNEKDGKQTPWKGHPVFTAQHALALCCRECMRKWYRIPAKRNLSENELEFFSGLVSFWINREERFLKGMK